jgi:hypothetical protein
MVSCKPGLIVGREFRAFRKLTIDFSDQFCSSSPASLLDCCSRRNSLRLDKYCNGSSVNIELEFITMARVLLRPSEFPFTPVLGNIHVPICTGTLQKTVIANPTIKPK